MRTKTALSCSGSKPALIVALVACVLALSVLVSPTPVDAQLGVVNWIQLGSDVDGETANDLSGDAVAMSADGTTVVIGAALNDGNGTNSGHARVFRWDSGSWGQLGADIDGENAGDKSGAAVSISADGATVAIGAAFNDGNGAGSGQVRVFRWDGGSWGQLGADIDGENAGDQSGAAVAISGDGTTVVIGARINAGNGEYSGHARVYRFSGGGWDQLGSDIDGEDEFDTSGGAVAISAAGDMVAVGASRNDGGGGSGHVRVFRLANNSWAQVGADIDGEGFGDQAGSAVAMSADGNTLIVGIPGHLLNISFKGGARIYRWDGSTWRQLGSVIPGERPFDFAGTGVAMSGDGNTVVIGSHENSGSGRFAGHARVYGWDGTAWSKLGSDIDGETANDLSGDGVAISEDGGTVVIGAGHNDGNGANSGHARVFRDTPQLLSPLCNGLEVTVDLALGETPTALDDVIRGTTGPDTINGLGGRDTICALQGGDTIDAGDGFDIVFGGSGNDTIVGGAGNDALIGGLGADAISGGSGNDRIQGGDGVDTLEGEGGYDIVHGGDGDDVVRGGTHDDLLFGNLGRDTISGDGGDDTIRGGGWLDTMDGGGGNDGCTLTDPSGNVEVRISCETGVFGR